MSRHVPTTEDIRRVYSLAPVNLAGCTHLNSTPEYAGELFDEWLESVIGDSKSKMVLHLKKAISSILDIAADERDKARKEEDPELVDRYLAIHEKLLAQAGALDYAQAVIRDGDLI